MAGDGRIPSSFRDPSGHLFVRDGTLYRQINHSYREHYDHLIASGLYDDLVDSHLLIAHEPVDEKEAPSAAAYRIVKPLAVPFISYPYEWCFSQLKDAALLTLDIQYKAINHGMSLKDASAYNVQFVGSKPVLIDTLSFEKYVDGRPWVAYRQFCQHFLAPLALVAYNDVRLNQLLRIHIDGIPLDLASSLLPRRTRFNVGLLTHLHLHARAQARYAARPRKPRGRLGRNALLGLIAGLGATVRRLKWRGRRTEWGAYYDDTNYTAEATQEKATLVARYLERIMPRTVWDLGANTGMFSRIPAGRGISTIAFDIDPVAVEKNYVQCRASGDAPLLPLCLDLTNPSPALGWANRERMSVLERGPADAVLALALLHHLAISNNVPFGMLADFFASICRDLIIEFVPKDDTQVQRLLATREDIFQSYDQTSFEDAFRRRFDIQECNPISGSKRILYHMRTRASSSP